MWPAVQRLEQQGHLVRMGESESTSIGIANVWHHLPNPHYFSQSFSEEDMSYGIFDFAVLGFPEIHRYFHQSVVAIHVSKDNVEPDIGTGFLLENRCIVTARHCIEHMQAISIDGWNASHVPLKHIWMFRDDRLSKSQRDKRPDLAILEFTADPLPGIPGFKLLEGQLLEDVLTMGYPPIPGFPQY